MVQSEAEVVCKDYFRLQGVDLLLYVTTQNFLRVKTETTPSFQTIRENVLWCSIPQYNNEMGHRAYSLLQNGDVVLNRWMGSSDLNLPGDLLFNHSNAISLSSSYSTFLNKWILLVEDPLGHYLYWGDTDLLGASRAVFLYSRAPGTLLSHPSIEAIPGTEFAMVTTRAITPTFTGISTYTTPVIL
jgi:hypothetical protein